MMSHRSGDRLAPSVQTDGAPSHRPEMIEPEAGSPLLLGPERMDDWDDFLHNHENSCAFQTAAWARAVENCYGHRTYFLAAEYGGRVRGTLPLCLVESRAFGRVLATSPFASYGAICADTPEVATLLVQAAIELAREHRADYLELKSLEATPGVPMERHRDYLNYTLPLEDPEDLWKKRLKGSTRTCLRKLQRGDIQYESGRHLVGEFFHIMATNMRALGTPTHSVHFFESILEAFGEHADILVARDRGVAFSGMLTLRHGAEVCVPYQSSLPDYRPVSPSDAVYWEAIRRAWAQGATRFGFGRSLKGSGPAEFKARWGATGTALVYEYHLTRRRSIPRINQHNPRYRLASHAWSMLPLPVTKWLGPGLIRNIV